jgi:glycosyltransferase involved in cell wall biosynthesis
MSEPFVNIGMVTFNRLDFTRRSIDSVIAHTKCPYVLTVVDNRSSDGTRDYLKELHTRGKIKNLILLDENEGVAKASNRAWRSEPDAAYYLKLDNDIVILKDNWLKDMANVIAHAPFLAAIGYNVEPVSYPLTELNGVRFRIMKKNIGGACFLIPKRTRRLLGYWCEDYGRYGEEDADYCERISLLGLLQAYMEDEAMLLHLPAGKAAVIDAETLEARDGIEEHEQCDYRTFKDLQRSRIIKYEMLFKNNREAYYSFRKPFYQDGTEGRTCDDDLRRELMNRTWMFRIAMLEEKIKCSSTLAEDEVIALADLYVKNPDYIEALTWVRRAATVLLNRAQRSEDETYKLGSYLKHLGRDAAAREFFSYVLKTAERKDLKAAAAFHLGEICYKMNEISEAASFFQQCLELIPEHKKAQEYMGTIRPGVEDNV